MESPQIKLGPVTEPIMIDKVRLPAPNISQATGAGEAPQIQLGPVPDPIMIDKVRLDAPQ